MMLLRSPVSGYCVKEGGSPAGVESLLSGVAWVLDLRSDLFSVIRLSRGHLSDTSFPI